MLAPVIRFRIDFARNSHVGPGKIDLLEAIRESGSLSQAARDLGMSYRYAWLLVQSLNGAFREPVTVSTMGGKNGGGVLLTTFGETLVKSYRGLEREIADVAARRLQSITPLISDHSKSRAARSPRPLARKRR
jgi:molybdate transport system regulatory protein